MAARSPGSGGNLAEFFALGTNAFGTKNAHLEDKTKSADITGHPNKKKMSIKYDASHADANFETFLTSYLTNQDLSAVEETYEDGSIDTISPAAASQCFGIIHYFGAMGTTRKTFFGVGVVAGDTGNYKTGNKSFENSPVQVDIVPSPATYAITATTHLNTSKVATAGCPTQIAKDSYGTYVFMTAA